MRFFTPAWHGGDLSDEDADAVPSRYAEHLASVLPRLPDGLRERLTSVNLHDAQFAECTVDHRRRQLRLSLLAGNNQASYATIDLEYHDVAIDRLSLASLRSAVADPKTELLYDEVDIEDGYAVHRFLAWPYQEFDVYFGTMQSRVKTAPRRLPSEREVRYVEVGAPAI